MYVYSKLSLLSPQDSKEVPNNHAHGNGVLYTCQLFFDHDLSSIVFLAVLLQDHEWTQEEWNQWRSSTGASEAGKCLYVSFSFIIGLSWYVAGS